jgi:hypothetical protein
MPIFFLCSLDIPEGILKQVNRIIRQCLWKKRDTGTGGHSLASWDMICKPKDKGGLGILDFRRQNEGLLMKHLHKFYNKEAIPWVQLVWKYYENEVPHSAKLCGSFWWRDIMKLVDKFLPICQVVVGRGDTVLFWTDRWCNGTMQSLFPRLFSFALDNNLSVGEFCAEEDKAGLFQLPLSQQAFGELQELQPLLGQLHFDFQQPDKWSTVWPEGNFTSRMYYKHCFAHLPDTIMFKWIWKSRAILKIKVFAWLLISDRLNTKDMLRRRHWTVSGDQFCVLCPSHIVEDWLHLFFHCNFSVRIWNYLQVEWDPGDTFEEIFLAARKKFDKPFFPEVVMLAAWNIWKQRNEAIFQHILPSFRNWRRCFIQDISLHKHRVRDKHVASLSRWIDTLL